MSDYDKEMYRSIFDSLIAQLKPETDDSMLAITHITHIVGGTVQEYINELNEAIHHLQETVRRLSV